MLSLNKRLMEYYRKKRSRSSTERLPTEIAGDIEGDIKEHGTDGRWVIQCLRAAFVAFACDDSA